MQNFDVHVCVVSNQSAPNFLPVCDERFKPNEVVLVVSDQMVIQAQALEKALKMKKIIVKQYRLKDIKNFDLIRELFIKIATDYQDRHIILNMTGGTKPLSFIAFSVFKQYGKEHFYYEDNQIVNLDNGDKEELSCILDINSYLTSYGYLHLKSSDALLDEKMFHLGEFLAQKRNKFRDGISLLNGIASEAEKENSLRKTVKPFGEFRALLQYLSDSSFINFDGHKIDLFNQETRDFLKGGWLEYYTFMLIQRLNKKFGYIQDVKYNYETGSLSFNQKKSDFDPDNLSKKKESDVIFMVNNKLYIIECKTCQMRDTKKVKGATERVKGYINGLKVKKELGGINTEVCLLSFQDLNQASLNYAEEEGVFVIQGMQLPKLQNTIQKWIESTLDTGEIK